MLTVLARPTTTTMLNEADDVDVDNSGSSSNGLIFSLPSPLLHFSLRAKSSQTEGRSGLYYYSPLPWSKGRPKAKLSEWERRPRTMTNNVVNSGFFCCLNNLSSSAAFASSSTHPINYTNDSLLIPPPLSAAAAAAHLFVMPDRVEEGFRCCSTLLIRCCVAGSNARKKRPEWRLPTEKLG